MVQFQHAPLPSARSIRLFALLAGSSSDVTLKLETFALDDCPAYDTISLDTGDAADTAELLINDATASVPAALLPALRQFRKSMTMTATKFWTEAICVDRASPEDRSACVKILRDIHKKAESVKIWLGDDDDEATAKKCASAVVEGWEMVCSVLKRPQEYKDNDELFQDFFNKDAARVRDGRPAVRDYDWSPLQHITEKPWFRRVQSIHESILPQEAEVCYGGETFMYALVGGTLNQLKRIDPTLTKLGSQGLKKEEFERAVCMFQMIVAMKDDASSETRRLFLNYDNLALLLGRMKVTCDDPHDRIYSALLLSLEWDPDDSEMQPDYSQPWQEVFTQFTTWALKREPGLHILSLPSKPCDELPSWVPDYRNWDAQAVLAFKRPKYSAGGKDPAKVDFAGDDPRVLVLTGRVVDTIRSISVFYEDVPKPEVSESEPTASEEKVKQSQLYRRVDQKGKDELLAMTRKQDVMLAQEENWFFGCVDLARQGHESPDEPLGMTSARLEQLYRTLCMEFKDPWKIYPAVSLENARQSFIEFADWIASGDLDTMINSFQDGEENIAPGDLKAGVDTAKRDRILGIEKAMGMAIAAMRFGVMESGRLALLPKRAVEGDEVIVVKGAQVPYVVRKQKSSRYELVGESLLEGLMHGEALENESELVKLEIA